MLFFSEMGITQTPIDYAHGGNKHGVVEIFKEYDKVCGRNVLIEIVLNVKSKLTHSQ